MEWNGNGNIGQVDRILHMQSLKEIIINAAQVFPKSIESSDSSQKHSEDFV